MQIIIYTPENEITNEVEIISQLLDLGADHLYIRKPLLDDFSLVDYMEKFDPEYYPKMISTSLIIAKEFELEGYHFTREIIQKNEKYNDKILEWLHENDKISSVSAHSIEEIKNYRGKFKHVIVSPVFKSISKKNSYDWDFQELKKMFTDHRSQFTEGSCEPSTVNGELFITDHRSQITERNGDPSTVNSELFAVGGVDIDKIDKIKKMHFDGFGLLGALWSDPQHAIDKFKEIIDFISYDSRLTTND